MLPSLAIVVNAHDFLTRRYRLRSHRNEALIAEALHQAAALAGDHVEDEPAALLFALSVRGTALGDGWELVPWVLAQNHARTQGFALHCPPEEHNALVDLRLQVAQRRGTFEQVRAWVAEHLHPLR
ncbi:MAG: hypothetical protein ABI193_23395 [Minicystis sp.]